ncbi:protein geranylgeranyltransferase-like protein type I beta subunit [Gorgonomyces haynaldii]|nr:protein geranylgeranyltransferase-like protein type I beta subunit [Gorgonomyces haynaldii]
MSRDYKYFTQHLEIMPHHYTGADTNRMTLIYFCVCSLDLLSLEIPNKQSIIDWVYSQQIHPSDQYPASSGRCGFRGGPFMGNKYQDTTVSHFYDASHVTMTYTALCILLILGDDLSRVNKPAILESLKMLQQDSGSFSASVLSHETDARFLFCACAIGYLLNDFLFDTEKAFQFASRIQNFDGAFGQQPEQESHGGSTYCAVAALYLLGKLDQVQKRDSLIHWLVSLQDMGFHGRLNKPDDTCYGFWIGASLDMLGVYSFVDTRALADFLDSTRTIYGGFGKLPQTLPDVMHSALGVSALAIAKQEGYKDLFSPLGISLDAHKHWQKLNKL